MVTNAFVCPSVPITLASFVFGTLLRKVFLGKKLLPNDVLMSATQSAEEANEHETNPFFSTLRCKGTNKRNDKANKRNHGKPKEIIQDCAWL